MALFKKKNIICFMISVLLTAEMTPSTVMASSLGLRTGGNSSSNYSQHLTGWATMNYAKNHSQSSAAQQSSDSTNDEVSLEDNTALVTANGVTEKYYLTNAKHEDGKRKDCYYDILEDVCFYHYDNSGEKDKSVSFSMDSPDQMEAGSIFTQDDFTPHWSSFFISVCTTDHQYTENQSCLVDYKNDFSVEVLEANPDTETYHIKVTATPHVGSRSSAYYGKSQQYEIEMLFSAGEVHSVVKDHGDAGNTVSAYKESSTGSGSSSEGTYEDVEEDDTTNSSGKSKSTSNKRTCPKCHGTGECPVCKGNGGSYRNRALDDNSQVWDDCDFCENGVCPQCDGDKVIDS